jgi:ribosomal protein S18 acetylase RimI-like enzyme
MPSDLRLEPALDHPIPLLCDVATDAFHGYVAGTVAWTPAIVSWLCSVDGADLRLSQIVFHQDQPVGFGVVSRKGRSCRLVVFGIVRAWQERKIGGGSLAELLKQSKERGETSMALECFEQNERGIRLYRSFGFEPARRLYGFEGFAPGVAADLEEIDPAEAARTGALSPSEHLPWQVSPFSAIRLGPPHIGFRLGNAYAIVSDPSAETLTLRYIAVPPKAQRRGEATKLVRALLAHFPQKKWRVAPTVPEEYAPIFERAGLIRMALNQFQMKLTY